MDLIRKQRLKFTAVSTLMAAVFLLIMLGGFFGMTYATSNASLRSALDKALDTPKTYNAFAPQAQRCFYVYSDEDGNPTVKKNISYDLAGYGESIDKIVSKAYDLKSGAFEVDGQYFICANKPFENDILIAVIDRSEQHEMLLATGVQISLLYILSVIIAAIFVFLMSARLLHPVVESFKKQRDLIANASHELKTPLAVIAANMSVVKSEPTSSIEDNSEWIGSIDTQIMRMKDLIQNMLELSKLEQTKLPKEELNFSMLCEGACLTFDPICFEKNVHLVTNIKRDISICGEKDSLYRLVVILLDNAIKYCNASGKVGVKLTVEQKKARLSVLNTGTTISKEEAQHVFDRFYRADTARKKDDNQSFGLGLSIAAATVKAHGGTISCQGYEGKGTIFKVYLPLSKKRRRKNPPTSE